jgi:hypothetical protein
MASDLVARLLPAIADRLIARAQRTPYRHIPGYMNRWWLLPYGRLGIAVRVHEILRSDDDRAFHDHPWSYLTIILRGGYTEVKPLWDVNGFYLGETRTFYGERSVLFRPARSWHRLEICDGLPAWTLFITGPKVQSWGFMREPENKVYWRKYLNDWDTEGQPGEGDA